MRIATSMSLALLISFGTVAAVPAQEAAPPAPELAPDVDDGMPGDDTTPGDSPPMVIPAPDAEPETSPDAFGSAPSPDDEAIDDSPMDQAQEDEEVDRSKETRAERIDRLFSELRQEADPQKARRIASRIERTWRRSGSATIDLLMQRAAKAMSEKKNVAALDLLDQALVLKPDYAEAWNRRATLNFGMDRWGKSLADIEQTLAREPRHWGALMGLAMILQRLDEDQKALETYMRVLEVYPALKSAQDAVGKLSEELTGPAI
ncbi:tetratricopeptide repeat protein [Jiella marina]|uniref:tetratricopeptide repeat protein n=1 Tax=Jiella sp. LLJ827 TaxID=2917712 RepID=UPI002101B0B0|nr:tetratricopeptide repeat protein [Jiella sp. LLJ827]MCQ0987590.1 tetratricopeptide repeat protein [Jiella sp. LLJ827]